MSVKPFFFISVSPYLNEIRRRSATFHLPRITTISYKCVLPQGAQSQKQLQANLSGPIIPGKLFLFGTVRRFVAEGHMYGVRQYNIDDTFYDEINPVTGLGDEGRWWLKGTYVGDADSIARGSVGYTRLNLDSLESFKDQCYRLGTGDSAFVPMNPYEKTSYHVKLT